ncbi:MAG TPA: glycosyltransferase family 2 protein [Gemmatimonadaceae bacterium]|nr:glycosyltransferase family 2 protein [Gemmatimonadaceae bacterium]
MPSSPDTRVSVVVIGYAPPELLARCLAALRSQRRADAEVLVVAHVSHKGESFAAVRAQFADMDWIDAPPDHNVARLRGLGIARSRAPVVALLEGDCVPAPDWLERLTAVTPASALGGAIEPSDFARAIDWAAFFAEFAPFMAPLPAAPEQLPGTNVVYRRSALPDPAKLEAEGMYETFVNAAIASGGPLASDSALVVLHQRTWRVGDVLSTRYNHGRGFGGLRLRGQSFVKRVPYMAISLALPALLIVRVLRDVFSRSKYNARAIVALPWIVVLSLCWAFGEFMGYAAGPGTSLEKWR